MKYKPKFWFGCKICGYRPDKDEKLSNKNWSVYDNIPCPKCGIRMEINLEPEKK
jgi:hypothetical protein